MKALKNLLLKVFFPTAIITAAIYVYLKPEILSPQTLKLMAYLPFLIFFIGLVLSLRFNKSRIFYPLILLTISLFILEHTQVIIKPELPFQELLQVLLGVIIPLNIFVFSLLKERGFLSLWGIIKFAVIGAQLYTAVWILNNPAQIAYQLIFGELISFSPYSVLPQGVLLISTSTLVALIIKGCFFPSYSDVGLIFTMASTAIPLHLRSETGLLIFFAAAGLILIMTIIQDSYRMSYIDELTSLPGRRALQEELLKLSGSYTIAMVDIDFFKKFNDKHGHDVGDEVLRMVASCLTGVTGGGKAFRYGGEEFTILFPAKEIAAAIPHLDSLRETVAKRAFVVRGKDRPKKKPNAKGKSSTATKKLFVTISIGAAMKDKSSKSPQEVMKNADKALYRAKNKGRNCVSK